MYRLNYAGDMTWRNKNQHVLVFNIKLLYLFDIWFDLWIYAVCMIKVHRCAQQCGFWRSHWAHCICKLRPNSAECIITLLIRQTGHVSMVISQNNYDDKITYPFRPRIARIFRRGVTCVSVVNVCMHKHARLGGSGGHAPQGKLQKWDCFWGNFGTEAE